MTKYIHFTVIALTAVLLTLGTPGHSIAQWFASGGQLVSSGGETIRFFTGDTLCLALHSFPPDSPYTRLQIEMELHIEAWSDTGSAAYLLVGTDSVGVLSLWGAGYDASSHILQWGRLGATGNGLQPALRVQKTKAITLIPLTHSLYFKWVISAEDSGVVEVNGVPLTTPPFILPWHVTIVGVALKNARVHFTSPKIIRE